MHIHMYAFLLFCGVCIECHDTQCVHQRSLVYALNVMSVEVKGRMGQGQIRVQNKGRQVCSRQCQVASFCVCCFHPRANCIHCNGGAKSAGFNVNLKLSTCFKVKNKTFCYATQNHFISLQTTLCGHCIKPGDIIIDSSKT